jgi:flagellar biosynthesis/type III secretory pathway M-ring protein FliF/YscJ
MLLIVGLAILFIILVFIIFKIIKTFQRKQPKIKPPEKPPEKKKEFVIVCPSCQYRITVPYEKPDIYGNVKSHLCPVCHTFMRIL